MTISTLRTKRALLLPAAALALIVGTSGCSLVFDKPDDPAPTSSHGESESDSGDGSSDGDDSNDGDSNDGDSDGGDSDGGDSDGADEQSDPEADAQGQSETDSGTSGSGSYDESDSSSSGSDSTDPIHKSFTSYLKEHGVSSVGAVGRTDPDAPAVTVNAPSGWHTANSRGPEGSYLTLVNDSPTVGSFKPNAIGYLFKVPGSTKYTSVTAATRDQLESLPGFDRQSTTYKSIGTHQTYGIAGLYNHDTAGQLGIVVRSVMIEKPDATYIFVLQTTFAADQMSSVKSALRTLQRTIQVV